MAQDSSRAPSLMSLKEREEGRSVVEPRLIACIRSYYVDVAIDLIERNHDVNCRDIDGLTPLHHAAARGMRPLIRALIKSGRCDYLAQDDQGRYAAEFAITGARDYVVARLLLKKQVEQANHEGREAWIHRDDDWFDAVEVHNPDTSEVVTRARATNVNE